MSFISDIITNISAFRITIGNKINALKNIIDGKANIDGSNIPAQTKWMNLRAGGLGDYTFTDFNVGSTFDNVFVEVSGGIFQTNKSGMQSWLGLEHIGEHKSKKFNLIESYRRTVIPLCLLENAVISGNYYFFGEIFAKRSNILYSAQAKMTIEVGKYYNSETPVVNVSYTDQTTSLFFRPVTFLYNNLRYFGIEIGSNTANYSQAHVDGFASDWGVIEAINFYNTQNQTILNAEIFNSLQEYTYQSDQYNRPKKHLYKLVSEGFIKKGGTGTNLLLDDGNVKPVSDFQNNYVDTILTTNGTTAGAVYTFKRVGLSDLTLTLTAASDSFSGVVTTGAQDFAGKKRFKDLGLRFAAANSSTSTGWHRIAKLTNRGYFEVGFHFPGGSFTPASYIIKGFLSWSASSGQNDIQFDSLGRGTYIKGARIVQDTDIYLEVEFQTAPTNNINQTVSYLKGGSVEVEFITMLPVSATVSGTLWAESLNDVLNRTSRFTIVRATDFITENYGSALNWFQAYNERINQLNITYTTSVYTFSILLSNGVQKQATLQVNNTHFTIDNGILKLQQAIADKIADSATVAYVDSKVAAINIPNGQLTVNTTSDLVGGYVYLPNGNVTTTLGLATHVLNAIANGNSALSQITSLFAGLSQYSKYTNVSSGGFFSTEDAFMNTFNPLNNTPNVDVGDHTVRGARLILQGVSGSGVVHYHGNFIDKMEQYQPTISLEGQDKEYVWDDYGAWREVF